MEVTTDSRQEATTPFNPLAGWEAASRWNASAFGMMAKAWQQWLALVTTVPVAIPPAKAAGKPAALQPKQTASPRVRIAEAHAAARAEPKRPARSRANAPKRPRS
jgi:hypothetical protein